MVEGFVAKDNASNYNWFWCVLSQDTLQHPARNLYGNIQLQSPSSQERIQDYQFASMMIDNQDMYSKTAEIWTHWFASGNDLIITFKESNVVVIHYIPWSWKNNYFYAVFCLGPTCNFHYDGKVKFIMRSGATYELALILLTDAKWDILQARHNYLKSVIASGSGT